MTEMYRNLMMSDEHIDSGHSPIALERANAGVVMVLGPR